MKSNIERHPSSFRDPCGYLFYQDGRLLRLVDVTYKENYDFFMRSGLYDSLVQSKYIISHKEENFREFEGKSKFYKILSPQIVEDISYPYEWSFSQLKDAALLTLEIQKRAIKKGMSLKDASAYNIQFVNGRPCFIDTLSFEKYSEGEPWVAYKQFCQHFLAPLALMSYNDIRLSKLLQINIDGVPLDLAASLLSRKAIFNFHLVVHVYLHARAQKKYAGEQVQKKNIKQRVGNLSLLGLLDSLEMAICKLTWKLPATEWGDYYCDTNYSEDSLRRKSEIVREYIRKIKVKKVWDFGANTGKFSRLATGEGISTIAYDIDPVAVEKNYLVVKKENDNLLLPLIFDMANPSPAIGWLNEERHDIFQRGPVDLVMGLALIHHLAISNNLPFLHIAKFFSRMGRWLIIEFVPKEDSQVQRLLVTRKDVFPSYTEENFTDAFSTLFEIVDKEIINGSLRTIYFMKNNCEV